MVAIVIDGFLEMRGKLLGTYFAQVALGINYLGEAQKTAHWLRIVAQLIHQAKLVDRLPCGYSLGLIELREGWKLGTCGRCDIGLPQDKNNNLVVDQAT